MFSVTKWTFKPSGMTTVHNFKNEFMKCLDKIIADESITNVLQQLLETTGKTARDFYGITISLPAIFLMIFCLIEEFFSIKSAASSVSTTTSGPALSPVYGAASECATG